MQPRSGHWRSASCSKMLRYGCHSVYQCIAAHLYKCQAAEQEALARLQRARVAVEHTRQALDEQLHLRQHAQAAAMVCALPHTYFANLYTLQTYNRMCLMVLLLGGGGGRASAGCRGSCRRRGG